MPEEIVEYKMLTSRFGLIDPLSIDDYISREGYSALRKALKMTPDEVISEVKTSQLKGRGGAGFPVGVKMASVRESHGHPKYLICNADEGEPGNFKDRFLMENDPHQVIEGMIICAYATGVRKGFIFIRGEYDRSAYIMENALSAASRNGFTGTDILGSGFDFEIEIYPGAGSYVCGEEFALMLSIEGNPGRSTYKPPFPTSEGLYNKPTQINNVESFSNIPHIILRGGADYARIGTLSSKGTKLISLCGNVCNKGLYEVPFGITLNDIVYRLGGGVRKGRSVKMVQLGGASGPCITPAMLDLKLDFEEMAKNGLSFGSGAVIVLDDLIDILDIVRNNLEFFRHESCGKCTPCREGITHLLILLDKFILHTASDRDLKLLETLASSISRTSICGLGQAASTSLMTTMKYFPEEYSSRQKRAYKIYRRAM